MNFSATQRSASTWTASAQSSRGSASGLHSPRITRRAPLNIGEFTPVSYSSSRSHPMNPKDEPTTGLKRRDFLLLGAAAVACAGCQGMGGGPSPSLSEGGTFDAGPVANYAADGVYSNFRALGFFIVRRGGKLEALSSICTHRRCKLNVDSDNSFYCHCHGSTFDPDGVVTDGPATRNLPVFQTVTNAAGHL